jgi:hypothetical protein
VTASFGPVWLAGAASIASPACWPGRRKRKAGSRARRRKGDDDIDNDGSDGDDICASSGVAQDCRDSGSSSGAAVRPEVLRACIEAAARLVLFRDTHVQLAERLSGGAFPGSYAVAKCLDVSEGVGANHRRMLAACMRPVDHDLRS